MDSTLDFISIIEITFICRNFIRMRFIVNEEAYGGIPRRTGRSDLQRFLRSLEHAQTLHKTVLSIE